jgi:hypothetical protein
VNYTNFNTHFSAECGQLGHAGQLGPAGQLVSALKSDNLRRVMLYFSALKQQQKNSADSFSAEKCQFMPCIAIFFSAESINFFQ